MTLVTPLDAGDDLWRGCLESFEDVRFRVRGGCMAPAAPEGAQVRLVGADRRRPRFGDLLLVRTRDGLRLHRLVWPPRPRGGARLRTAADRSRALDPAVGPGDVLGVVTLVEHGHGTRPARARLRAARSLVRVALARLRRAWRAAR